MGTARAGGVPRRCAAAARRRCGRTRGRCTRASRTPRRGRHRVVRSPMCEKPGDARGAARHVRAIADARAVRRARSQLPRGVGESKRGARRGASRIPRACPMRTGRLQASICAAAASSAARIVHVEADRVIRRVAVEIGERVIAAVASKVTRAAFASRALEAEHRRGVPRRRLDVARAEAHVADVDGDRSRRHLRRAHERTDGVDHGDRAGRGAASGRTPASLTSFACGTRSRETVDLRHRSVFVVLALDREHRAADARHLRFDVPRAERRIEPDVVPAPERGVRVGDDSAPSRARRSVWSRRRARLRCCARSRPRRRDAARPPRRPRRASGNAAAYSSAIEAPSLWPNSHGDAPARRSAASNAGSTSCRLAVHEVDRPAFVVRARRRPAVTRARVDEAAHARARRKAAPESPSTSRASPGLRAGTRRAARSGPHRSTRTRCRRVRPWAARLTRCRHRLLVTGSRFAQLEALDLAGRGLRQLGDETDLARILVRRELVLDERLERSASASSPRAPPSARRTRACA